MTAPLPELATVTMGTLHRRWRHRVNRRSVVSALGMTRMPIRERLTLRGRAAAMKPSMLWRQSRGTQLTLSFPAAATVKNSALLGNASEWELASSMRTAVGESTHVAVLTTAVTRDSEQATTEGDQRLTAGMVRQGHCRRSVVVVVPAWPMKVRQLLSLGRRGMRSRVSPTGRYRRKRLRAVVEKHALVKCEKRQLIARGEGRSTLGVQN